MCEENVKANDQFDMYQKIFLDMYQNPMFCEFFQSIVNKAMTSDEVRTAMKYHYEYGMDIEQCIPYVLEMGDYVYSKLPINIQMMIEKEYVGKIKTYINNAKQSIISEFIQAFKKSDADNLDTTSPKFSVNKHPDISTWLMSLKLNPYLTTVRLPISMRLQNALCRSDILVLRDIIAAYRDGSIYGVRNIGARSIVELSCVLIELGIPEEYVPVECVYDDYPELPNPDASSDTSKTEDDEVSDEIDSVTEQAESVAVEHINYNPRSIRVRCVETGEVFSSLRSASQAKRTSVESIRNVLNGRYEQSCGYHWERV